MTENEEPQIYNKRYKIIKKLGAGNFGTAYLVTDLQGRHDQKVLKVVRLGEMEADQTVDSVREAELLSKLHNEYIVKGIRNTLFLFQQEHFSAEKCF
ncbi:unnamed protein product [Rotaria sp. Silwood1]|nr:unnamed protein product [Rotaria sp. Silwood1]